MLYLINNLMKNQSTPFEQMGFEEESDLRDIFKLLSELDRPKNNNDIQESSNKSHPSKPREYDPPISEQSEPQPVSLSQKLSPQIKRKYTSVKLNDRVVKIQPLKSQVQNSLNHQSIISAESVEQVDSQIPIEIDRSLEKQNFIIKNSTQKFAEKNKTVSQLQRQLQQYHSRYNQKQIKFIQEKNRQKDVLAKVLKQGNLHAFKYHQYLQHINAQHNKIINDEVLQKNTTLLKTLKEEQSKYKPRKKIKNTQTMSLSDQQEQKLSEFMQKQKKHYFSVIGAKIEKQRQKYEAFSGSFNTKKMSIIAEQRVKALSRVAQMKDILPLCIVQSYNKNVEEMLALDLQKCHQVRVQCIKFNPTTSNEQRSKIFDIFIQQITLRKKLLSNHHIFNQKSTLFVSLSSICLRDDEILLINQCNHSYFSLQNFLNRIQLGPPQQQFHIVRYIIRICLKAIQDLNTQMKQDTFVILPLNLYFNQKWQLKLSNVVLNQLLFLHFRHILHQDDYYYFPPEEKPDKHSFSLWSLGILIYFLSFPTKPFPKYQPYHWNSREEFFMFNQLQIPQKSPTYDKCKDFIMYCLTKKGIINFNQVCSQPFLTQAK